MAEFITSDHFTPTPKKLIFFEEPGLFEKV